MASNTDLQPALDACQNQLSLTMSASDSLDTKALGIVGFDIALLIYILQSELAKNPLALTITLLLFGASLILCLSIIVPKNYAGAVVDLNQHSEYLVMGKHQLVLQLISDTQDAVILNTAINDDKSQKCIKAIWLSLAWTVFTAGCIIKV